ncbi:putative DNA cross-link repair 1A protein [Trypanosoma theileri]|uniref:Putative DNA cross-link repair 1A protein n=1 Tax=Trypanosoma theileri TaxID=67003 RepID=A0A1X0NK58_9TRYP|nr:putative DNA cross-link repair 1A protein [Trypanosoma theileri]ORC84898.1 putative DNA cross-link repair 1A protein [Trypanosoma theileri]
MKFPLLPLYIDQFTPGDGSNTIYLLSHFHTDHMKGLSNFWCAGKIICDQVTRALLIHKYGVSMEQRVVSPPLFVATNLFEKVKTITEIPFCNKDTKKDEVELDAAVQNKNKDNNDDDNNKSLSNVADTVTLYMLPAFHIPGSVMFFLETPFGNVLYTGDFKYNDRARQVLEPFFAQHRVDHVYLDDTWLHLGVQETCSLTHGNTGTRVLSKMLSERELDEAIEALGRRMDQRVRDFSLEKKEITNTPKGGPYVLRVYLHNQFGKEHLVQRLAKRLGIIAFVEKVRYEQLQLLTSFDTTIAAVDKMFCVHMDHFAPYTHSDYNTTFPRIEVVSSLKHITAEELQTAATLNDNTPHYGVVMSGWARLRSRNTHDEPCVWEIPTTLHSTPQEIMDFMAFLRPLSVTPLHYKPCRGMIVMERLGPYLRRPYVNQFLSISDNVQDNGREWHDSSPQQRNNNNNIGVQKQLSYKVKRSGFCIRLPTTESSSFHVGEMTSSNSISPPRQEREKRKRETDTCYTSEEEQKEEVLDKSYLSSGTLLSQLADLLDL